MYKKITYVMKIIRSDLQYFLVQQNLHRQTRLNRSPISELSETIRPETIHNPIIRQHNRVRMPRTHLHDNPILKKLHDLRLKNIMNISVSELTKNSPPKTDSDAISSLNEAIKAQTHPHE